MSKDFNYKNVIGIPHTLALTFIKSPEKDLVAIASVFMNLMLTFDVTKDVTNDNEQEEAEDNDEVENISDHFTLKFRSIPLP